MSEVNADGVLLNPHEAILQEAQNLTNSLMAEKPEGLEEDMEHDVQAANGEEAGEAGGNRTWQLRTRCVWWRPRDWWEPLRPPTPW